jgi:hypothetical protein
MSKIEIDFHDAIIDAIDISFSSRKLSVKAFAYGNDQTSKREPIVVSFSEISSVSLVADVDTIIDNSKSGNVNQLVIDRKNKAAYVYMIEGILSVKFEQIESAWMEF